MSVYVWFYRSRETRPMTRGDIEDILGISRTHNAEHAISGMLLYHDGRFTQVIEGSRSDILDLKARILADPRHTDVTTLYEGEEPERTFAQWSMAFHYPDGPQRQQLESTLPIDWGRRTLKSIEVRGAARQAFSKMADWASDAA